MFVLQGGGGYKENFSANLGNDEQFSVKRDKMHVN